MNGLSLGPDVVSLLVGALSVVITRLLDTYLPGKAEPACPPGKCWVLLNSTLPSPHSPTDPPTPEEPK